LVDAVFVGGGLEEHSSSGLHYLTSGVGETV
jgi:hypothetical protein